MTDTRTPPYGEVDRDYAMRLATMPAEDDGPIWMVNLMSYRARAVYDGEDSADVSGREADDRYAPVEILADIGAEVVFLGDVEDQFLGETPRWDRVGVVKYPSRRSFIAMQERDDFQAKHVHKEAGMAATIVAGCTPVQPPSESADVAPSADRAEVPHPPTDDDGPVVTLDLVRFHPGTVDTEMALGQDHAGRLPIAGGRIAGWFGVEGTIVGDGRQWDEARFDLFPSKAAFMDAAFDADRPEARRNDREVAIADAYTLLLRPTINTLPGETSLPG